MKRRTFILGGGVLATLSLGVTATNASLANTVSSIADFRAVSPISRPLVYVDNGNLQLYDSSVDTETAVQNSDNVQVIGDAGNIVGGSNPDVPYVTQKSEAYATELNGNTNQLVYAGRQGNTGVSIKKSTSRLTIGEWPPSSFSGDIVLTPDKNAAEIIAINPDGDPNNAGAVQESIATLGNGCSGVVAIADIDDDGSVEIVFVDGSQQLRYLEQNGSSGVAISNGGIGTNNGHGVGYPADFGQNKLEIPFVDGSNNPAIVDVDGNKTTLGSGIAAKAPVAPVDIDGDYDTEFVFFDSNTGEVNYIDDIRDGNTVNTLLVEGSAITPDQGPGLAASGADL